MVMFELVTAYGGDPFKVAVPLATVICPAPTAVVAGVQPAGIVSTTAEPDPKSPILAVNVNVKVLVVLPYVALVGLTVIIPSPSTAGAATATSNGEVTSSASKAIREAPEPTFRSWVDRGRSVFDGAGFMAAVSIGVFITFDTFSMALPQLMYHRRCGGKIALPIYWQRLTFPCS